MRHPQRSRTSGGAKDLARIVIVLALTILTACHPSPLDFTLPQVRGGTFHLRAHSFPILLAFVQTIPDTADTPSRNQIQFLRSMSHQYSARGLQVVLIDASALAGQQPPHDALLNATYDWHLDIPLLEDHGSKIARTMQVTELPTLILLTADRKIANRWQGFTPPATLAQAIEQILSTNNQPQK